MKTRSFLLARIIPMIAVEVIPLATGSHNALCPLHKPALLFKGADEAMTAKVPFTRPAPPKPATALPAINIGAVWARAHINEPTSNNARNWRYVIYPRQLALRPTDIFAGIP